MQFTDKMITVCDALRRLGHEPFMSKFKDDYAGKSDSEIEKFKQRNQYENDAIREFWKPMQAADVLLVLNYDKNGIQNYIGGNTFLEMGFAHVLNQRIYLWGPIPDMPYYHTELLAMRPIVINGDLTKIK